MQLITPRIKRRTSVMCAVAFCLMPVFFCSAGSPVKTVAAYTVSSKGFTIGDVSTTQRTTFEGGASRVQFETRTAIRASFLWMGYRLTSTENGTLLNGVLVNYSAKGEENGAAIDVEGRLVNEEFRFDLSGQGTSRTVVIPRSSYDYTTMECPEARLDFSKRPMITLRILDVEKMAVVKRDYRFVGNEQYTLAGKDYPCRVVVYSDQNKNARRWIAWDGTAVIMYRQDSRGEKNSYSVQATSVVKEL
jgi:hypothetical protein